MNGFDLGVIWEDLSASPLTRYRAIVLDDPRAFPMLYVHDNQVRSLDSHTESSGPHELVKPNFQSHDQGSVSQIHTKGPDPESGSWLRQGELKAKDVATSGLFTG